VRPGAAAGGAVGGAVGSAVGGAGASLEDLERELGRMVRAVPRGRVTTFGDLAASLGDPVAARAVAAIVRAWPSGGGRAPAHRVVLADGSLGGDDASRPGRARALRGEGVRVRGGRVVGLEEVRVRDLGSAYPLRALGREQDRLRARVHPGPLPYEPARLVGVDVAYSKEGRAWAAAVAVDARTLGVVEERTVGVEVTFPYIPTYLAFRELPAVAAAVEGWDLGHALVFIDGQGAIHPRGLGIACHVGVALGVPTVGVAKSPLWGTYDARVLRARGQAPVVGDGIHAGWAVRPPRGGTVFASAGHMVGREEALDWTVRSTVVRQPVPLELAHRAATAGRRAAAGAKGDGSGPGRGGGAP
jgi:deoxyribonuclease V